MAAPAIRDGVVVVVDGTIAAVGPAADVLPRFPRLGVIDLGDVALGPGFVDVHCHLEWSLADGAGCGGTGFAAWLGEMIGRGAGMGPDDFLAAARAGARAAAAAGTTFVVDSGPTGAGATALRETGLRGHVCLEAFGRLEGDEATEAAEHHAARVAALDGDLVRGGVAPHAPYTVSPAFWAALRRAGDLADRPWTTHLAESPDEEPAIAGAGGPLSELFAARGATPPGRWPGAPGPVRRLAAAGALHEGLVAAHCVHVDGEEAGLLATHGVGVAHCPGSNRALDVGIMPLAALAAAGARLGLGSDSPATRGRYDVRAEASAVRAVHGPAAPDEAATLRLATLGGAEAAGVGDRVGSLEPGKRADLVAVVVAPGADPVRALLSGRIRLVVVDGCVVARDGVPTAAVRAD